MSEQSLNTIAEKLKYLRKRRGYSRKEFGRRINRSEKTVQRYEEGGFIDSEMLLVIANALNCPAYWLGNGVVTSKSDNEEKFASRTDWDQKRLAICLPLLNKLTGRVIKSLISYHNMPKEERNYLDPVMLNHSISFHDVNKDLLRTTNYDSEDKIPDLFEIINYQKKLILSLNRDLEESDVNYKDSNVIGTSDIISELVSEYGIDIKSERWQDILRLNDSLKLERNGTSKVWNLLRFFSVLQYSDAVYSGVLTLLSKQWFNESS